MTSGVKQCQITTLMYLDANNLYGSRADRSSVSDDTRGGLLHHICNAFDPKLELTIISMHHSIAYDLQASMYEI